MHQIYFNFEKSEFFKQQVMPVWNAFVFGFIHIPMKGTSGTRPKENLLHILENAAGRGRRMCVTDLGATF